AEAARGLFEITHGPRGAGPRERGAGDGAERAAGAITLARGAPLGVYQATVASNPAYEPLTSYVQSRWVSTPFTLRGGAIRLRPMIPSEARLVTGNEYEIEPTPPSTP